MGFREKVKDYWRALLLCLALLPLCGCYIVHRGVAVVNVPDQGEVVHTKYRYYCIEEDYEGWLRGEPSATYKKWIKWRNDNIKYLSNPDANPDELYKPYKEHSRYHLYAREAMPDLFSDDGIPLVIKGSKGSLPDNFGTQPLMGISFLYLSGLGQFLCPIYPMCQGRTDMISHDFWLATEPSERTKRSVRVCSTNSTAMTGFFSPVAELCFRGTPDRKDFCDFEGGKMMRQRSSGYFASGNGINGPNGVHLRAMYYGIAVRLKEMEDAGIITDKDVEIAAELHAQRRRAIAEREKATQPVSRPAGPVTVTQPPQPVSQPLSPMPTPTNSQAPMSQRLYRIVASERENSEVFARRFVLEVLGDIDVSTERTIRREYIEDLKLDYAETYGLRDLASVYVDFTQFSLKDRRIEGRAVVFTATPDTTMQYDANTRRGKITVRFNSSVRGTDWARGWARRNIETLVRDKNILLTTGEKPPEGHYLSRGEQWHGDVLEIEFETE